MVEAKLKRIIAVTKDMNILYVEDNSQTLEQTHKLLKNFFDQVDLASNGKEALEYFESNSQKYSFVLTDILMPIMDGLTMTKNMKQINNEIPIIVLSAYDEKKYLLESIKLGIYDYIFKPCTLEDICAVLEKRIFLVQEESIQLNDQLKWFKNSLTLFDQNENEIQLTKSEKTFLKIIIEAKGGICTNEMIENIIFNDLEYTPRRIRNIVANLRKKIDGSFIDSVYSVGYKLSL